MMKRPEFTVKISILILQMVVEGENPIGDFWKRTDEEQARLYEKGRTAPGNIVTKCDGVVRVSRHQRGCALDILFLNKAGTAIVDPRLGWEYWHEVWTRMRGAPPIEGDMGHFEG